MIKIFLIIFSILLAVAFFMIVQIWKAILMLLTRVQDLQDSVDEINPFQTDENLCKRIRKFYTQKWKKDCEKGSDINV